MGRARGGVTGHVVQEGEKSMYRHEVVLGPCSSNI